MPIGNTYSKCLKVNLALIVDQAHYSDGPTALEIMEDVMLAALARGGALGVLALLWPSMCFAWGNEGHKTVALTAEKILSTEAPHTLAKGNTILAEDKPARWPGANLTLATE